MTTHSGTIVPPPDTLLKGGGTHRKGSLFWRWNLNRRPLRTADVARAFLASKRAKGLSTSTLDGYHYRLNVIEREFEYLPTTPQQIESFLSNEQWAPANRATYFRFLRTFYRWLERREYIRQSPIPQVESPKVPYKVSQSLSSAELRRLLTHPSHKPATRAFLYLLADTGLRLGEALSVTPERLRTHTVVVDGKVGQREVPISPEVRAFVLRHVRWNWSSRQAACLAVRRAFRRCEIHWPRAAAHALRHTFVRQWNGDESVLVGIMGWTSARMMQVYRPYNVDRAIEQHRGNSPIADATPQPRTAQSSGTAHRKAIT